MLAGNWREVVARGLMPIGRSLRRSGITAEVVTVIGILMAAAASVAIGLGYLRLGYLLLVLTGVPDALDGAVAKAAGTSSSRGAFFDSVADRLTDALLFGGVAWYLAGARTDRTMMLPVAIMATAKFISYQRAKAESLGYDAKGGLMERAERFIVLGVGLLWLLYDTREENRLARSIVACFSSATSAPTAVSKREDKWSFPRNYSDFRG